MERYIYELPTWPGFSWQDSELSEILARVRHQQGRLLGRMESLGFEFRSEAILQTLSLDVLKSSEIEGEFLNPEQVRSSIAKRLGINVVSSIPVDRDVEGVVEMMLDAAQNFEEPLTKERLFAWHASLFPTGRSGMAKIQVGAWRDGRQGAMEVVSGPYGKERVHFVAPDANRVEEEMTVFLSWFNEKQVMDDVLKAAIAHLWFVTIHPFEDGNGRIARALTDLLLARADGGVQKFYSMSAQIRKERRGYYEILENTEKQRSLDVTPWLKWFLLCLEQAVVASQDELVEVLKKAHFWEKYAAILSNPRHKIVINKLFKAFEGKLTSSKWAKLGKCSQDTALRDIQYLMEHQVLVKEEGGGRSTSYRLNIGSLYLAPKDSLV